MPLRSLPSSFSPAVVADIDARLAAIEREEGVSIPLAVESGSRAWGFPSPDSDYDCRFVFVRPTEQHLTLWPRRDVIETPLVGDLDVNGWELGKALRLLLKGNAVIIEWLRSPIAYCGEAWFRDEMLAFAERHASREMIGRHYLRLGERQRRVYFGDDADVPRKKLFYALRPAAALRWLRLRPGGAVVPMHFPTLMAECDPPADVQEEAERLLALKAVSHEMGTAPLPRPIAAFIDDEFERASQVFLAESFELPEDAKKAAEDLFRRATRRLEPTDRREG